MTNILDRVGNLRNRKCGATIVLTHGDMDGVVSAFQLRDHLYNNNQDTKQFKPFIILSDLKVTPEQSFKMLKIACKWIGVDPSELTKDDTIYILDRPSFRSEDLEFISNKCSYVVIDHHETSVGNHELISQHFDKSELLINTNPEYCGATLTMEYISKKERSNIDRNPFKRLAYITNSWDTFLWTKFKDETDIKNALAIQSCDKIFGPLLSWKYLLSTYFNSSEHDVWEGFKEYAYMAYEIFNTKLEEHYNLVKSKLYENMVRFYNDKGRLYRTVVLQGMEEYQSMLAHNIFRDFDCVDVVLFYNLTGTISIRTREDSGIKANDLAVSISQFHGFSGGGHPNAAGGRIKDSKVIKDNLYHKVIEALQNQFSDVSEGGANV